jgi:hypothetical protein
MLQELGPYCGALCAVEVFATLVQNPGGGGGASLASPAPGLMGRNGSRPAAEAAAAEAASAVLADGAEEGEIVDSDEAAPDAMQLSGALASRCMHLQQQELQHISRQCTQS